MRYSWTVTGALTLVRGLAHRLGTTLVIFVVALCAAGAATVGPTYFAAGRHSILQDTIAEANVVGRGLQVVQQGPVRNTLDTFRARLDRRLDRLTGGAARTGRLLQSPVEALETRMFFPRLAQNVPLVWRTDVCHHLTFRTGRCPSAGNEVAVSTSLVADNRWRLGQTLRPASGAVLTIAGIYAPPPPTDDYWFGRSVIYFPAEVPTPQYAPFDAMFTPRSTIETLPGNPQGSNVIARTVAAARVQPADLDALQRLGDGVTNGPALGPTQVTGVSGLASTVDTVRSSTSGLAVPVVVVTAELLVLTWLLLFLVVTDAVEARGVEIALAKLRGYGGARAVVFGLSEPVVLLAVSLPVGTLLGWAVSAALSHVLLRAGTPVTLPGLAWAVAAGACLGGVAAVVVAARRTLTRPVVEQWRHSSRRAADRSWVFDAVVLTGAVAGLVQLAVGGTFGSARHSALALLVPGLLGLAIAVVGSRLVPVACRASFRRTRNGGTLGPFLAVRHLARRPGGTRTTMILATAVALATFSIATWSVGAGNRSRVADVTVGAPTVLTVGVQPGDDLAGAVDRIDPGGRSAAAVEAFTGGPTTLVAAQPARLAAVAHWSAASVSNPRELVADLHPPAPPPIVVSGDRIRVHVHVRRLAPAPEVLTLEFVARGATAPTPVELGRLPSPGHRAVLGGELSACPCTIQDLQIAPPGAAREQVSGTIVVEGIDVHRTDGWHAVEQIALPGQWDDTTDQRVIVDSAGGGGAAGGVRWSFFAVAGVPATLTVHDHPVPLPAVVSSALAGDAATVDTTGLDGADLTVAVTARASHVPSAADTGIVVDLTYAQRAAYGNTAPATAQVWVRGDVDRVRHGLARAGFPVLDAQSSQALDDELGRQGPGLASVLFLADAVAAAVLAALAAVLSLSAAARRRRYEYAALGAAGATPRTLYAALAIEQLVVVGVATALGVAAGLLSTALAGHSVPEFVTAPTESLLHYRPSVLVLVLTLGGGFVVILGSAAAAAAALLRSVSPEQLREAPS